MGPHPHRLPALASLAPLRALGEPMYLLESNPTVERIAKLVFDTTKNLGFQVVAVRVWETPTSYATYGQP